MTCGELCSSCVCVNERCKGIHVCDCGGSWSGALDEPDFHVYALPGGDSGLVELLQEIFPQSSSSLLDSKDRNC